MRLTRFEGAWEEARASDPVEWDRTYRSLIFDGDFAGALRRVYLKCTYFSAVGPFEAFWPIVVPQVVDRTGGTTVRIPPSPPI